MSRAGRSPVAAAPRASVVIPCYWSSETLASCLEGLRRQTFGDFEAIVINSSPESATRRLVSARFAEVRFDQSPVRLLPHAARNRGVESALGRLLVFTDPDCIPRPDWLERLIAAHEAGHEVVGGAMGLAGESWFDRGVHLCKFHEQLEGLAPGPRGVLPTANVLYSRRAWQLVGPFDGEIFAGDATLCWRASRRGLAPWFEPRAVVDHRHPGTPGSLWRQRVDRGREFAAQRAGLHGWSRPRLAAYLLACPVLPFWVLARAARYASRAGWRAAYWRSLPLQALGQVAWSLGEARAHARLLVSPRKGTGARACASA